MHAGNLRNRNAEFLRISAPLVPRQVRTSPLESIPDIRTLELRSGNLRFSFKHLDLADSDFSIAHRDSEYFCGVLEKLKSLSAMRATELRANRSKAVRCHPIKWNDTTKQAGFHCLNKQLRDLEPWQLQIEKEIYGRMHGFFIDDIFFIVWFDSEHRLYP
jgi:hypothetical protein